jgi:hypothetical protein
MDTSKNHGLGDHRFSPARRRPVSGETGGARVGKPLTPQGVNGMA